MVPTYFPTLESAPQHETEQRNKERSHRCRLELYLLARLTQYTNVVVHHMIQSIYTVHSMYHHNTTQLSPPRPTDCQTPLYIVDFTDCHSATAVHCGFRRPNKFSHRRLRISPTELLQSPPIADFSIQVSISV